MFKYYLFIVYLLIFSLLDEQNYFGKVMFHISILNLETT